MDMLTRHVGLPLDRPRANVDLAAADDDHGAGNRLVPGKNRDHGRTLALGSLSIQLPAPSPAAGTGVARRFGRSLVVETERANRYPALRSLLAKAAGVMVLADAEQLQSGDHSQDFVALKLLSLIGELRDEHSHTWRSRGPERRPLALGADQGRQVRRTAPTTRASLPRATPARLWNDCPTGSRDTKCSRVPSPVRQPIAKVMARPQQVPLRIEPRGIIEPFGWLMTELDRTIGTSQSVDIAS